MSETVVVTGGGGFIGSHLVEHQLGQGFHVRTIDLHFERLQHLSGNPKLEMIAGDLTNQELQKRLVESVDTIYHLASAHLDVSLSDEVYQRVNVEATLNLARAASTAGIRRFVHCSSVGVIGHVKAPPADEETPCHPTQIYERTKLEGEQVVLEYAQQTGLEVVVCRPAWVYGPGCPRTRKLISQIKKGQIVIFGDGNNLRHPIYVSDAVEGLEQCAQVPSIAGQIFIIAGEQPVTVRALTESIARVLTVKKPFLYLPVFVGWLAGKSLELVFKPLKRSPPYSTRSLDFFTKNNAYRIDKARQVLGFEPHVGLLEGLQMTVQSLHGV